MRLLHAITFFPNTVLSRGPDAVRSGLNTRIKNQAEQRQEDVAVALIGCSYFEFLQHTFKDSGFSSLKITTAFEKCRVCGNEAGGVIEGKQQSCFPD